MTSIIGDQQRLDMERQGFTVLEGLFTASEMAALAERIEAHQRRHNEALLKQGGGGGGISRANEITFTDHIAEGDPEIMAFIKRPELVDVTTSLLGPDIDLYWNQSVYKAGGGTKQFPWHQDDGYMAVTPAPYLTLWLAVNDVTVENGCIWVLPGTHKKGLIPHEDTAIGKACYSLEAPDQGIPVPLKAGSLAVFWSMTIHKSGLNTSDGMRKGFVIQYANAGLLYAHDGQPVVGLTPVARQGCAV